MFQGRNFLTLLDYTPDEIRALLKLAHQVKAEKKQGIFPKRMANKNVVLLFEKTSTRTRCAFETAAYDEGANVTFLSNSQMGKKESLEDTARVLGRLYDGIEYRGFEQSVVEQLADRTLVARAEGAELLAFGSARPRTEERYDTGCHTTYFGHAQAILRMGEADATLVIEDADYETRLTIRHITDEA